jgi:predicted transporter
MDKLVVSNGNGNGTHSIALWSGLTALFTNLGAVAVIDLFASPNSTNGAIAAVITSLIIGATVYSKQRWDDEKANRERKASTNG